MVYRSHGIQYITDIGTSPRTYLCMYLPTRPLRARSACAPATRSDGGGLAALRTPATRHLLLNLNQRRARQAVKRTRNKKKAGKE